MRPPRRAARAGSLESTGLRDGDAQIRDESPARPMTHPAVIMTNIYKSYAGVLALRDASFQIEAGEVVALVGENGAGKSTLMKILLGIVQRDAGEVRFAGRDVSFRLPSEALRAGISMIHQEISLVDGLSVAENIWLGREGDFARLGMLGHNRRVAASQTLLDQLGFKIDPRRLVSSLSIAEMQLVEVARAVSYDSTVIIMDEPTSALTPSEIELLYSAIRSLTSRGVAVVYISHKLDEVFELADRIVVMRDGATVGTFGVDELDTPKLVSLIAGRELEIAEKKRVQHEATEEVLRVEGLTGAAFTDVSFHVNRGEVLGFSGLMGAGRTEIMRALFGLDPSTAGTIHLNGETVSVTSPRRAVALGLAMVTEDRLRSGSIYPFSVVENSTIAALGIFRRFLLLQGRREVAAYGKAAQALGIKAKSPNSPIGELSGGNQQKVLISRWLHRRPKVLILDEPTRGIDVGAKAEIYRLIDRLASEGIAIIVVSSELAELFAVCDRIVVIRHGCLVAEHPAAATNKEELLAEAFGIERD